MLSRENPRRRKERKRTQGRLNFQRIQRILRERGGGTTRSLQQKRRSKTAEPGQIRVAFRRDPGSNLRSF